MADAIKMKEITTRLNQMNHDVKKLIMEKYKYFIYRSGDNPDEFRNNYQNSVIYKKIA